MKQRTEPCFGRQDRKRIQGKQQKEKRILKNEEYLRNILDKVKNTNVLIMGTSEGELARDQKPI